MSDKAKYYKPEKIAILVYRNQEQKPKALC